MRELTLEELIKEEADTSDCLEILYNSVRNYKVKTILELGVRRGFSTRALLLAAKDFGAHLWSIDKKTPWPPFIKEIREAKLDKYWTFIKGNDLKVDWNQEVDLLFIDTVHTYNQLKAELTKYSGFAKTIFIHDTKEKRFGNYRQALLDFLKNHPEFTYQELETKHGLARLIRKNLKEKILGME